MTAALPPGVVVRVYACSDVGRTRDHNEDAYLVAGLELDAPLEFDDPESPSPAPREVRAGERGVLFVVADGLGGAAAGELASQMAVRVMFDELRARLAAAAGAADAVRFATALRDSTLAANGAIHEYAKQHPEFRGTGTTSTAAALLGDTLFVAQVGDSRAYLVRDGNALQITKDQSLVQKLVEAGEITPEQAETSVRRNIILQALGPEPTVKVDLTHQSVRHGDTLVLCSDGLSGQVRSDEIARAVAEGPDLAAACLHLIARANETGGPDNITVVAARFEGGLGAPAAADEVGHRPFHLSTPTPEQPVQPIEPVAEPRVPPPPPRRPGSPPAPRPAVVPVAVAADLASRRDRARVIYVALALAAALVAVFALYRLLG